jgi:hypothetical protein
MQPSGQCYSVRYWTSSGQWLCFWRAGRKSTRLSSDVSCVNERMYPVTAGLTWGQLKVFCVYSEEITQKEISNVHVYLQLCWSSKGRQPVKAKRGLRKLQQQAPKCLKWQSRTLFPCGVSRSSRSATSQVATSALVPHLMCRRVACCS